MSFSASKHDSSKLKDRDSVVTPLFAEKSGINAALKNEDQNYKIDKIAHESSHLNNQQLVQDLEKS